MIIKRVFNPIAVLGYVRKEMAASVIIATMVVAMHGFGLSTFALPFSVAAILGSALAIFIAFRNNSAYGRWWEARTLWAGITNASRVLARLVITFTDSHAHQPNYDHDRGERFKRDMIHKIIAWVHALRLELRNQPDSEPLRRWVTDAEFSEIQHSHNKPNRVMMLIGKSVYQAMSNGTLGGFDSFQIEGQLLALTNHQGGCERIKYTPLLRQYHYFTNLFLLTFIVLLPFSLISDFERMGLTVWMIPVTMVISFVFAIIGKVGEVNEDPFENRITDVPLTAICNTIERDLLDILGETPLPNEHSPINGFLD